MRAPGLRQSPVPPFPPAVDALRGLTCLRLGCAQLNNAAQSGDPNFIVQVSRALDDSMLLPGTRSSRTCSNQRLRTANAVNRCTSVRFAQSLPPADEPAEASVMLTNV